MNSEKRKTENIGIARRPIRVTALMVFVFSVFHFTFSAAASAQDDPPDTAPPPLKLVSKDDRQKLAAEDDIKDRTNLALQMMDQRLDTAEKHSANKDFDAMFRELGYFHALVDDSVTFLEKRDVSSKKVLDTFKKLEIGLRGFIPRLETVRRELPLRYEDYVRHLMKFVREARARAIDPMFSENVVKTKNSE